MPPSGADAVCRPVFYGISLFAIGFANAPTTLGLPDAPVKPTQTAPLLCGHFQKESPNRSNISPTRHGQGCRISRREAASSLPPGAQMCVWHIWGY